MLKNLPTDDDELSIKEKTFLDMLYPKQDYVKDYDENNGDDNDGNEGNEGNDKREKKISFEPSKSLKNSPKDIEKVWYNFNDIIIATVLFIVLTIPLSDKIIEKFVRIDNFYYRLAAKSLVFAIILFFINNFSLLRKSS